MKAVLYARVSSKDQEKEGFSIPAQIKLLNDYAKNKSINVIKEFIDVETAKKAGRTNFNEMLSFLKKNKDIKIILVEKTDRLYRNFKDYVILEDIDLEIHLVKEGSVLSKDAKSHEKLMHGFKVLIAKNYIDNLSEECKKGMNEKAEQGYYPSRAPMGYINTIGRDGKKFIKVDETKAPFIKRLFELFATGNYSLDTVRSKLSEEGFVYGSGKSPFYKSTVWKILNNEFYTGIFTWQGKTYEKAKHAPIISKELFYKVQRALNDPTKPKSKKREFAYTNLIKCGVCGCYLTAEIKKEKYIYYHCTGNKGNCKQPYIRQEEIEDAFADLFKSIQLTDEQIKEILLCLKDIHSKKIEYHNNSIENIEKQIHLLQKRIDSIYIDKIDGKISEEYWQEKHSQWKSEKDELLIRLNVYNKADNEYFLNINLILELAKNAYRLYLRQPAEEKRKLIKLMCSNFSYQDRKLDITLNSPFQEIIDSKRLQISLKPVPIIDTGNEIDIISKKWYPQGNSNPCRLREREVS